MSVQERRWVQRYLDGDGSAFDEIYDANADRIYRLCYRLCGSRSEAEDLMQEVFVAASRGLKTFEHRSSLGTWLYRIAQGCWRTHLRQKAVGETATDEERREAATGVRNEINIIEHILLEEAILALPDDLRNALILVKCEGLKYREAAKVLGIPQGTIQFRVHEAIIRMRSHEERATGGPQEYIAASGKEDGRNVV